MCSPKPQGLRCELLSRAMLSLSNDTLAVMEGPSSGTVRFFETAQGKPLGEAYTHWTAAVQVALNQVGLFIFLALTCYLGLSWHCTARFCPLLVRWLVVSPTW